MIAGEPPVHTLDEILPDDEAETYRPPQSSIRPDLRDKDDESTDLLPSGRPARGEVECPTCFALFPPHEFAKHLATKPEWCDPNYELPELEPHFPPNHPRWTYVPSPPSTRVEFDCDVCGCSFPPDEFAEHQANRPDWCTVNARYLIGFEDEQ